MTQFNEEESASKIFVRISHILERLRQLAHDLFSSTTESSFAAMIDIIAHLDFLTEGPQAIGEGFNLGTPTRPAFKGKVLVIAVEKDSIICHFTFVDQFSKNGMAVRNVDKAFSSNSGFDFYMPPTGHDLN